MLNSSMCVTLTAGVMKQILDFVYQMAEDSYAHACAVRELLIWLTVQVRCASF